MLSLVLTLSLRPPQPPSPPPGALALPLPGSSGQASLGWSDSCPPPPLPTLKVARAIPGPVQRPAAPHYQAEHSAISPMDSAESRDFAGVMDGPGATISASCPLLGPANLRGAQEAGTQHASQLRCTDKPQQSAGCSVRGHIRKLMGLSVGSASWLAPLPAACLARPAHLPRPGFVPFFPLFPVCNKCDSCQPSGALSPRPRPAVYLRDEPLWPQPGPHRK